jgi:hypothetical protein
LSPSLPSRSDAGSKRFFLHVEPVFREGRALAENTKTRPDLGRHGAHPEMRVDAGFVLESDKGIVVDACSGAARLELSVHGPDRPEQLEGLVDEMAAEVEENTSPLLRRRPLAPTFGNLRAPPLETRLEPKDLAHGFLLQKAAERQEIAVPAAILKDGQHHPALVGFFHETSGLGYVRRERFVDDHR